MSTTMSRIDTSWLHMEHPTNLMMVSGIIILNQPLDVERFKRTIEARLLKYPRFSQIVENASRPYPFVRWKKYVDFNIDEHIKKIGEGIVDQIAFNKILNTLVSTPLDLTKPLWQMHVVNNYKGGAALIVRLHHCIADGSALIKLILACTDLVADAPLVYGTYVSKTKAQILRKRDQIRDDILSLFKKPIDILLYLLERIGTLGFLLYVLLWRSDPKSMFKGQLSETKTVVWSGDIPLEDVKKIGKSMNGTVNDILTSALSGAISNYMRDNGEDPSGLTIRAAMPVDIRDPKTVDQLGNRFGVVYAKMPLGITDHIERLHKIRKNLNRIKRSRQPFYTFRVLSWLGMISKNLTQHAVKILATKATTVFSNVKGPQIPLFLAGSLINDIVFWVPQSGRLSVGISILSYNNKITLGIISDTGLIPNPEEIIQAFHQEIDSLLQLSA